MKANRWLGLMAIGATIATSGCNGGDKAGPVGMPKGGSNSKKIVFIFKSAGQYSEACRVGAEKANKELKSWGASVEYYAPEKDDVGKQIQLMQQMIANKVGAIVIAPNDPNAIIPVIKKAIEAGVKVFTWDTDAPESERAFYVAAADDIKIGVDIAEALAKDLGGKGKVAIMSGGRAAANLNLHVKGLEDGFKKSPGITILQPYIYNEEDQKKAVDMAKQAFQKDPDIAGFACINSQGPPGVGEAVTQLNKIGKVKVWGLALPSQTNAYLKSGAINGVMLWDPGELTYLTAMLAKDFLDRHPPEDGKDYPGIGKIKVDKLGKGLRVIMPGVTFTKENVDKYKF